MERQLLLLGVLRAQQMHGYQLNDFLEKHYDFVTDLKPSTAYYLLDRLAALGYATMHYEQVGNRPQRRVYEITPEGEAYFFELLRANLAGRARPIYDDEVGLAFLDQMPPGEALRCLEQKIEPLLADVRRLEDVETRLAGSPSDVYLATDHHLTLLRAELAWWQNLIERMNVEG